MNASINLINLTWYQNSVQRDFTENIPHITYIFHNYHKINHNFSLSKKSNNFAIWYTRVIKTFFTIFLISRERERKRVMLWHRKGVQIHCPLVSDRCHIIHFIYYYHQYHFNNVFTPVIILANFKYHIYCYELISWDNNIIIIAW